MRLASSEDMMLFSSSLVSAQKTSISPMFSGCSSSSSVTSPSSTSVLFEFARQSRSAPRLLYSMILTW